MLPGLLWLVLGSAAMTSSPSYEREVVNAIVVQCGNTGPLLPLCRLTRPQPPTKDRSASSWLILLRLNGQNAWEERVHHPFLRLPRSLFLQIGAHALRQWPQYPAPSSISCSASCCCLRPQSSAGVQSNIASCSVLQVHQWIPAS